eukprot:scaffold113647_cov16-Prasinocladus_malaysianus.AAC.1
MLLMNGIVTVRRPGCCAQDVARHGAEFFDKALKGAPAYVLRGRTVLSSSDQLDRLLERCLKPRPQAHRPVACGPIIGQ